jgi:hypothetical protein
VQEDLMGARHALTPTPNARLGRLAGRGALTASAALALAGGSSGVALAHEGGGPALLSGNHGSFADDGLLCGLLGGDCSSSSGDDSEDGRDAGSDDDATSILERMHDHGVTGYGSRSSSDADDSSRDSGDRTAAGPSSDGSPRASGATPVQNRSQEPSPSQGQSLDTPPPPGQVRTIKIPG